VGCIAHRRPRSELRSCIIVEEQKKTEEVRDAKTVVAEEASRQKMEMLCAAADEQKALEITVLDMRKQSTLADYFVLCTGTSATHIRSIAEGVQDKLRERARVRTRPEGEAGSFWVILDYGDVILHVFDEEKRDFYDLERLWADAPSTKWAPAVEEEAGGATTA